MKTYSHINDDSSVRELPEKEPWWKDPVTDLVVAILAGLLVLLVARTLGLI